MRVLGLTGGAALVAVAISAASPAPSSPSPAVLVGAGDIAACGGSGATQTATLLDGIPGTVFAAGDLAYPTGSADDFANCFDPTWGRFRSRMLAAPGNHEYMTPDAAPFFDDLGAAAGPPGQGYFATDIGAWRVYVLNANCGDVPCDEDSTQVAWLRADLAAQPRDCVAAIWHQPRFSSGPHGDGAETSVFWDVLYGAGAELVINGHDHIYERFAPQDPTGRLDEGYGVIEFVVGTGGVGHYEVGPIHANSLVQDETTLGVLRLTLDATGFAWDFLPVPGATFQDSGMRACHEPPPAPDAGDALSLPPGS